MRVGREVRSGEAEGAAALVAVHDLPLELVRPPQELGRRAEVALADELADAARGDALDQRHGAHVEPERAQELDVPAPAGAESEVLARDDHARADPRQVLGHEGLRLPAGQLLRELDHEHLVRARFLDQLQAALEGRQQLHVVAQDEPRVRIEGEHRRAEPGRLDGLDHGAVAAMDAVEGAERNRALRGGSSAGERATITRPPREARAGRVPGSAGAAARLPARRWSPPRAWVARRATRRARRRRARRAGGCPS